MKDFSEKRAFPRRPMLLRVTYEDRALGMDATENLSREGLFIQTEHPFEIGQRVALAVSFPGLLNPIELMGQVAWRRPAKPGTPSGVGIQVEREEDKKRLEALLNYQQPQERPQYPDGGYRVLIVEDNPHIIEMYSYVLKKLASGALEGQVPLEVDFANDGHQALQKLHGKTFHLVITDLYMPVLDGFVLMERIRSDAVLKTLPVVVISAAGREAQTRALDLGVDVYLRKPVKFVEVLDTVKRLLRIQ
ncbi:MAG: response regulator [Myxococcaceae bacterium]